MSNNDNKDLALSNPHAILDPAVPGTPSSQYVSDEHGRIVSVTNNERAELVLSPKPNNPELANVTDHANIDVTTTGNTESAE